MNRLVLLLFMGLIPISVHSQYVFRTGKIVSNPIKSRYQEDSTSVLTLSSGLKSDDSLAIVFLLPVVSQKQNYKYGVAVEEVKNLIDSGLIKKNVLFVQPSFIRMPWYGNHPSNVEVFQEEYLLELIKAINDQFRSYRKRNYLLGFSKSGWGSMSFLMRYSDIIDGVFIWDAPLSTGFNQKWTMDQVFENEKYFNHFYKLDKRLSGSYHNLKSKNIIIGGYDLFRKSSIEFLNLLDTFRINYSHYDSLNYDHTWNHQWIYPLLNSQPGITNED